MLQRILKRLRGQRGEIPVFFVLLVPTLVIVMGLIIDGGGKAQTDEQALLVAQSAARAGANAGTQPGYGNKPSIDTRTATAAARTYLNAAGATGTISTTGTTVRVEAQLHYEPKLLGFGNSWTSTATGVAEPRSN